MDASCGDALLLVGNLTAAAGTDAGDVVVWFEPDGSGGSTLVVQTPVEDEDEAGLVMQAYEDVLMSPVLGTTLGSQATFDSTDEDAAYTVSNPYVPSTDGDDDPDFPVAIVAGVAAFLAVAGLIVCLYCSGCCSKKRVEEEDEGASKDAKKLDSVKTAQVKAQAV